MELRHIFSEVHSDYRDGNFFVIDAWRTDNGEEEGEVVAVVHISGDVYYINNLARYDIIVNEEIEKLKKTL